MRVNAKNVGGLRINGKVVGGMRIGGKVVALGAAPVVNDVPVRVTIGAWGNNNIQGVIRPTVFGFSASPIPPGAGGLAPNPVKGVMWIGLLWSRHIGTPNIRFSGPSGTDLSAFPRSISFVSGGTTYTGNRVDSSLATRIGGSQQVDYNFGSNVLVTGDSRAGLLGITAGDTEDFTLHF